MILNTDHQHFLLTGYVEVAISDLLCLFQPEDTFRRHQILRVLRPVEVFLFHQLLRALVRSENDLNTTCNSRTRMNNKLK